ncbi:MAG: SDR family oxidoreductase [Acidimicrobiia bacterium]|nr:SDR family oxidoreductase [Acidimicrobiia bacterium]
MAAERAKALAADDPALDGRIDLVEGDLTADHLGVADHATIARDTTEIYHLAAVYDLGVSRELGMAVNVTGTRNVVRFAGDCPNLARHHYVSTCYVSGRHCGPFRESDLEVGQRFNNYYEETKFLAELEVAGAREGGVPTTVYRPSIVVGDSRTGETQKFDGPYFLLQWLLRQGRVALVPYVGDPTMARFNVVPSDFVLDAITHLSGLDRSVDVTYQLADPRPLTIDELLREMVTATGQRALRVRLPLRAATLALDIPLVQGQVGIPASAVEYFVHPTHYLTDHAERDLAGSGVACPPLPAYLPTLVEFLRANRDRDTGVMV